MPSIVMTERRITAGKTDVSIAAAFPVGVTYINLVLTSSEWMTKSGTVQWGLEASQDNGVTWQVMGGSTFTIGVLNKDIYMPTIGITNLNAYPNALWRMYIKPSTTIMIGMTGTYG